MTSLHPHSSYRCAVATYFPVVSRVGQVNCSCAQRSDELVVNPSLGQREFEAEWNPTSCLASGESEEATQFT